MGGKKLSGTNLRMVEPEHGIKSRNGSRAHMSGEVRGVDRIVQHLERADTPALPTESIVTETVKILPLR
jgi:hypothetical protein